MAEFRMPSLGADMDSGVLLEWLVEPGATVHKGDIVAVVDTAKAAVEIECFESGVLDQIVVQPGTRVPVGAVLATITTGGAAVEGAVAPPLRPAVPVPPAPAVVPVPAAPPTGGPYVTSPLVRHLAAERGVDLATVRGTGPGGRVTHADVQRAAAAPPPAAAGVPSAPPAPVGRPRVSPLGRRTAAELGVDLAAVTGTGPGGAIGVEDVRRAAAARIAEPTAPPVERGDGGRAPAADRAQRAAAMRAAIAALMARSKREIPHYYLTETIDLGPAVDWLTEVNRQLPVPERLVPAALLLKATALAARAVPQLNGFWVDGDFRPGPAVHLGVAVSLRGGGLVAPAIHDATDLPLAELMSRLRDLVARTRAGRLTGSEMADPTITVSNLGDQGVESILGVIYPPQVALVGFGRVVERPWAVHGLIGVRPIVTASLAGDHRATDGATGARFLHTLGQLLQEPEEL